MLTITKNFEERSDSIHSWSQKFNCVLGCRFNTSPAFNELIHINSIIKFFEDAKGCLIIPSSMQIIDFDKFDPYLLPPLTLEVFSLNKNEDDVFYEAGIRTLLPSDNVFTKNHYIRYIQE